MMQDRKTWLDWWLPPIVIVSAAIGSFIAIFAAGRALLHLAGR